MREVDPRGVTDDVGRPCRQQLAVRGDATPIVAESGAFVAGSLPSLAELPRDTDHGHRNDRSCNVR